MARTPKDTTTETIIYTLSDPNTKEIRYIGKTVKSLKQRLTGHIYSTTKERNHRTNWIASILKTGEKPVIEYLDSCQWINSQYLEQYWIEQFKNWGFNLVNNTDGGEGNLGRSISIDNKIKLKESNSKKVHKYDLNGDYIESFDSCQDAANSIKMKSNSKVAACARGERRRCGNYRWSYIKMDNIGVIRPHKLIGKKMTKETKKKLLGKTNRTKGHVAERYYCNIFKELGFTFCTTARLGSRLYDNAKIDLINLPFNVQIKAGIQKSMNPGKELFSMNQMVKALFPAEDDVHNKASLLIHKKESGRGVKRLPEHEIVFMSFEQFKKYKQQNEVLEFLFEKEFKFELNSDFKHIVAMTFESFKEEIIKKLYLNGSNNNATE